LRKEYEDLRKEYEDLRNEYEDLRYTFNNNKSISSVIPCDIEEDYGHPTQKPVKIIREFLLHSSKKNGVVLDPFMGSGTTAIACKQINRQYIGFELDKKYYDLSIKRLKNTPVNLWNYDKQLKLEILQT
jgi:DNA modification methylase